MVTLRPATCRDLTALRIMMSNYYRDIACSRPEPKEPWAIADELMSMPRTTIQIIMACGNVAGFAVTAQDPPIVGVQGRYFGEFYIVPNMRKSSVPMVAASMVVRQHPGEWTCDVLCGNVVSGAFVRGMIQRVAVRSRERSFISQFGEANRFRFVVEG